MAGGDREAVRSDASKRGAVISGDSGKSCNLRGVAAAECNNARCEIHFPGLGLTPIYEISATLQPATIYSQARSSSLPRNSARLRDQNFGLQVSRCSCDSPVERVNQRIFANKNCLDEPPTLSALELGTSETDSC